jgi:hypothetical protein
VHASIFDVISHVAFREESAHVAATANNNGGRLSKSFTHSGEHMSSLYFTPLTMAMLASSLFASGPFREPGHAGKKHSAAQQASVAATAESEYEFVPVVIEGAFYIQAIDITNQGIVSGLFSDEEGLHSFAWINGITIKLDKPGAELTAVAAMTESGRMFGNWGSNTEQHAGYYHLRSGKWTELPDIPGYSINIGNRMAENGRAVGYACKGTFEMPVGCVGWLWTGKDYEFFSLPGALETIPFGINYHGQTVGLGPIGPNTFIGFIGEETSIRQLTIDAPRGRVTATAYDITEKGVILGASPLDPNDFWPSILIDGNSYTVLPKFEETGRTFYYGLNDRGDVVGSWGADPQFPPTQAFVAYLKKGK